MFKREIGETFEYRSGDKIYTLKTCEPIGNAEVLFSNNEVRCEACKGCFFSNGYVCKRDEKDKLITGLCAHNGCCGYNINTYVDRIYVMNSVKDLFKEINKDDVEQLTKAIKSIGDSVKIVELFKQVLENNKQNGSI